MPTPFPGMDPWLEHPDHWPDVHNTLIATLRAVLVPALRPRYVARLEERAYLAEPSELVLVGRPDLSLYRGAVREPGAPGYSGAQSVDVPVPAEVRETWIEIRVTGREEDVVTVVELLSPTNKRAGSRGRKLYESKRRAILQSRTHLVEVDLLRGGPPMPVLGDVRDSDYRILVTRGDRRPRATLLTFSVRDPIPRFLLPLRPGDSEPDVDLGAVLNRAYDAAAYDLSVDYARDPVPPLTKANARWCAQQARRKTHRR